MSEQKKISCIGDSITFGQGVMPRQKTLSYPALLQKKLGDAYTVSNFGVMNRTCCDIGKHPYTKTSAYTRSLFSEPDIVTIKLGTNDSWQGWIPELFETQLTNLIHTYHALPSHPEIILLTPFYCYHSRLLPKEVVKSAVVNNEVVPLVRKVAEDLQIRLVDVNAATDGRRELLTFDGVHPNEKGNAVIADMLYDVIHSLNLQSGT